ncbi:apolipoprotein N-acyltransferase [Ideonella margarita]|uniref:Apolipoprotein N-acyltransferase n=1 Tax=Ideonella margarita TaxID=2984191 RepID=A0ABU9C2Q5_9BURK
MSLLTWLAAPGWRGRLGVGAAAVLAGALHTASFAPNDWWWLQLASLAALAHAVMHVPVRRAAWLGGCFSLGWLTSGLWWLWISMHDFGGMPAALAAAAVLALCGALSLYMAAAMALAARLRQRHALVNAVVFAACWLLAELARGQLFTGFPWIASGYAHTTGPLATLAPWVGVYGIGAAAALLAAAGAAWLDRRQPGRGLATLVALTWPVLGWLAPSQFTTGTGLLSVSLLQPNVAQDLKFDPDHIAANMVALAAQVQQARGTLVVTPESVLPLAQAQLDPGYWGTLTAPFERPGRAALIGTFLGNETDGYVNSLAGVSAGRLGADNFYRYGKRHLLPFGEFVPPGFRWLVDMMQIPLGDQASGQSLALLPVAGQRVRPLICYEDLFGEDFAATTLGAEGATVLANATNLAWFGRWMVQDQHLQFSRMRALELQRPLVRATNTGATAVVNHLGEVVDRLPAGQPGTLEATVEGRVGATPYARWVSAAGLWPLWLLSLIVVLVGWKRRAAP